MKSAGDTPKPVNSTAERVFGLRLLPENICVAPACTLLGCVSGYNSQDQEKRFWLYQLMPTVTIRQPRVKLRYVRFGTSRLRHSPA